MNIAIKLSEQHNEELELLTHCFASLGQTVTPFVQNIYHVIGQTNSDTLLFSQDDKDPELLHFLKQNPDFNRIVFTSSHNLSFGKNPEKSVALGRFGSTLKYGIATPNDKQSSDVLLVNPSPSFISATKKLVPNNRIKIASYGFIPTPYSVGVCNPNQILNLAKSSKVVIVNNQIMLNSLILNDIVAFTYVPNNLSEYIENIKSRESYILAEKKHIQSDSLIRVKINEIIGYFSSQA